MSPKSSIVVSAPGKIHLLGEHAVVYGKPALLTSVNLRLIVTITPSSQNKIDPDLKNIKKIIEGVVKKELNIKKIPSYDLEISSKIPIGSSLGSSAAVSASYIAALLSYLKVKWDLELINKLAFEVEKIFHGNPSGADNSTAVFGGLVWYRKETPDLKIIHPLSFSIPPKIARNFSLINTGTPKESTKDMVVKVKELYDKKPKLVNRFLEKQEKLVRDLIPAIKELNDKELIRIIREGEKNLESIGVCSPQVKKIIREIESAGGAAKICGGGGSNGPTGVLLCYHKDPTKLKTIIKSYNLDHFNTTLGVEGLRLES